LRAVSHGDAYLKARGLDAADVQDLLFHPDLAHYQSRTGYPALIGVVRDDDGKMVGLHRTWLDHDEPKKAALDSPKKSLGTIRGGAIRLYPAERHVILTEGIETALAIRTARPDVPVWAAIAAGHLAACRLPDTIREVVIAADHDSNGAGIKAAERLAERLVAEHRRAWIAIPTNPDTDFADLLVSAGDPSARRARSEPPRSTRL
jgi:putative DNA primase/helicase